MIYEEAKKKVVGLAVIVTTPWTKNYEIDHEGLRQNVRFLINHGIVEGKAALFVSCGVGESYLMTPDEIKAVIRTAVEEANGRVPVLFGSFFRDTKTIIDLLKFGEKMGVYGAQIAPPSYNRPDLDEIFSFYKTLNDSTELGIFPYANYYSTGTDMPLDFIERFSSLPKVIGMKWMSADPANEILAIARFKDRFNFMSNTIGGFVWGAIEGLRGIVSVISNFAPEYELKLWDLLKSGRYQEASHHMMRFSVPFYTIYQYAAGRTFGIAAEVKAAMEICGRPSGGVRPPQKPVNEHQYAKIKELLVKAGFVGA